MNNMVYYDKLRKVPQEATKPIDAGRLKGMTDINPMWRIKMLTEVFGPCGIGWYTELLDKNVYEGADGLRVATVDINLYVKTTEGWSMPIFGTGGNSLVSKEKAGPYTSDECFKMAYTDALSVACKSLGMAADIYYAKDRTKYTATETEQPKAEAPKAEPPTDIISQAQIKRLYVIAPNAYREIMNLGLEHKLNKEESDEITAICKSVIGQYGYEHTSEIKKKDYDKICKDIEQAIYALSPLPII